MGEFGRRDFIRKALIAGLSPWIPGILPEEVMAAATGWSGRREPTHVSFLSVQDYSLVERLVSLILPGTHEDGGALEAGVPEFIDAILRESDEGDQKEFSGQLEWLRSFATEKFGSEFVELGDTDQIAILSGFAPFENTPKSQGELLFKKIKNLTVVGYQTSKIAADKFGNYNPIEYAGCNHPEHQAPPKKEPT